MTSSHANAAAHMALREKNELIELLQKREAARVAFWDHQRSIEAKLNSVSRNTQEAFDAVEKIYKIKLPEPEDTIVTKTPTKKATELLDNLSRKEKESEESSRKRAERNRKKRDKLKKKGKEPAKQKDPAPEKNQEQAPTSEQGSQSSGSSAPKRPIEEIDLSGEREETDPSKKPKTV